MTITADGARSISERFLPVKFLESRQSQHNATNFLCFIRRKIAGNTSDTNYYARPKWDRKDDSCHFIGLPLAKNRRVLCGRQFVWI